MSDFVDDSSNSNLKSSNRTNKFGKMQKSFENDYNNYNNQDNNLSDTKSSKFKKMDSDTSFTINSHNHYNNKTDVNKHHHKNEKIKTLKNKIEKQMKDYVDREDYDEMIKLVKKLNLISDDKWEELESEVEKLDYTDAQEYKSTADFLTDDDIALLAQDLGPGQKNRQSTPFNLEENRQGTEMVNLKLNYGHKRSILRKLMIAQRKQFLLKKEQADLQKAKNEFDDTSISNFSQISGQVEDSGAEQKMKNMNDSDKDANFKY